MFSYIRECFFRIDFAKLCSGSVHFERYQYSCIFPGQTWPAFMEYLCDFYIAFKSILLSYVLCQAFSAVIIKAAGVCLEYSMSLLLRSVEQSYSVHFQYLQIFKSKSNAWTVKIQWNPAKNMMALLILLAKVLIPLSLLHETSQLKAYQPRLLLVDNRVFVTYHASSMYVYEEGWVGKEGLSTNHEYNKHNRHSSRLLKALQKNLWFF